MELLTVREAAQILKVNTITIRRYIASGKLAAERVGRGVVRVRREALDQLTTPVLPTRVGTADGGRKGKPTTADDPLWTVVGIGHSGAPAHAGRDHDAYLTDAYTDKHSDAQAAHARRS